VIADELAKMTVADKNLFIILLSGTNKELQQELSERYNNNQIKILSYYQPLDDLYKISSLFITKPGGLSTAEALYYDLPIILTHALPGQEALNISYLLKNGLILGKVENIDNLHRLINSASEVADFSKKIALNALKTTIVGVEKDKEAKVLVAVQNMLNVKFTTGGKVN
jgi:processive 1,2-diacylglycerol beta-glucosyltransferase